MAIFRYIAETSEGRKKRGQIVGLSEPDALVRLRKMDLNPISVTNITGTLESKISMMIAPIKAKELVVFARQFSVMISANVTVVESLMILVDQTSNISLKNLIAEVAYDVDSGSFLSEAFSKYPKVFSNFFINIIRSGETSGKLDEVLNYLADEMEQNYDMKAKIKGAMIYPIFIISALVGVGIVLMVYVIPNLTSMLTETNATLPLSTRIVISVSDFLQNYLAVIVILIIALVVGVRLALRSTFVRYQYDLLKLRLPIFGKLFKYIYLMRFTRSLSTLIKGGVTITKSLEIVADIIGNEVYKDLILETLDSINDGNPVYVVMDKSKYVPKMVPQMISVGEKTGKLDSVLDRVTEFYGRETRNMLDNLTKLMEPIIMVIMGIGVGIMVAAVIMPMYNMASQF
ncbi:MAG: type II secretion system F family protein [Patescibacteria group bacterium]|jgi:type IV pilus assembly protein PilC|nr:type II secretion system F family protein [bacterium]HQC50111.1 type II secretion system F family protein [bacterium]